MREYDWFEVDDREFATEELAQQYVEKVKPERSEIVPRGVQVVESLDELKLTYVYSHFSDREVMEYTTYFIDQPEEMIRRNGYGTVIAYSTVSAERAKKLALENK
jgi:hypothetical protein